MASTAGARQLLRHPGAALGACGLAAVFAAATVAGRIAPDGHRRLTADFSQAPSLRHPMGTDAIGHDLFLQVLHGAQKSLQVAMVVTVLATVTGTTLGALAGYRGGWVDSLISRLTDLVLTVPVIVVLVVAAARLREQRESWLVIALLISVVAWPQTARVVRAAVLSVRERTFVSAAQALGASPLRILVVDVLPNAVAPIAVSATLTMATAVLLETALSFLGLGVAAPETSLGRLVATGQSAAGTRPWLFYFPGIVLVTMCVCVAAIGEGLRSALDPGRDDR